MGVVFSHVFFIWRLKGGGEKGGVFKSDVFTWVFRSVGIKKKRWKTSQRLSHGHDE